MAIDPTDEVSNFEVHGVKIQIEFGKVVDWDLIDESAFYEWIVETHPEDAPLDDDIPDKLFGMVETYIDSLIEIT